MTRTIYHSVPGHPGVYTSVEGFHLAAVSPWGDSPTAAIDPTAYPSLGLALNQLQERHYQNLEAALRQEVQSWGVALLAIDHLAASIGRRV